MCNKTKQNKKINNATAFWVFFFFEWQIRKETSSVCGEWLSEVRWNSNKASHTPKMHTYNCTSAYQVVGLQDQVYFLNSRSSASREEAGPDKPFCSPNDANRFCTRLISRSSFKSDLTAVVLSSESVASIARNTPSSRVPPGPPSNRSSIISLVYCFFELLRAFSQDRFRLAIAIVLR